MMCGLRIRPSFNPWTPLSEPTESRRVQRGRRLVPPSLLGLQVRQGPRVRQEALHRRMLVVMLELERVEAQWSEGGGALVWVDGIGGVVESTLG